MARQVQVEYDVPLERRGDFIRVRIVKEAKTVVDFVVQYEAYIDSQYRPIVRYDGSHGRPHFDVLDWDGEAIEKHWAPLGTTNNQALTDAIDDISTNSDRYYAEYLQRRS